jgi:hydroxymethylglutaryl-CoA lyase
MSDSASVIERIEGLSTRSKKMLLVVNTKGAERGVAIESIDTISYPFSISPKFSELNLNSSPQKQLETVKEIFDLCESAKKELVVYISMAFGNPYGDEWSLEILAQWIEKLQEVGVRIIPLSNVTIEIDKDLIRETFATLIPRFPGIELGLHLHTANVGWYDKIDAAYLSGCRRYDGVMQGMGGCPMTGKEMLGNLSTENLIRFMKEKNEIHDGFDLAAFEMARTISYKINTVNPVII